MTGVGVNTCVLTVNGRIWFYKYSKILKDPVQPPTSHTTTSPLRMCNFDFQVLVFSASILTVV